MVGTVAGTDTYQEPRRRSPRARTGREQAAARTRRAGSWETFTRRRRKGSLKGSFLVSNLNEFNPHFLRAQDRSKEPRHHGGCGCQVHCTQGSCDYNDQELGPGLLGYIHYRLLKPVVCRDSYSYPNVGVCSLLLASSTSSAYCITPATQTQLRLIVPPSERPTAL